MAFQMTDVTLHIDESLDEPDLQAVENDLRGQDGVISVHHEPRRPHLMLVEYDIDASSSRAILNTVTQRGLHAELIGL